MRKNSTYVHKPNENYIVIQKSELEKYLAEGYIQGTGISKEEYRRRVEKGNKTVQERYGVECSLKLPHVKEACQSDSAKQKRVDSKRQFYVENYGVSNNSQLPGHIDKFHNTCIEKYGSVENAYKIRNEHAVQTSLEKYGTNHPMQNDEVKQNLANSMLNTYGVTNYAQTPESRKNSKAHYEYLNESFDSLPELALFIYAKDHNEDIVRNSTIKFGYEYDNKVHYYFPDFIYKGKIIEIKGDHFFNNGTMINPYDRSQDGLYQAKYMCGLNNGVEFWRYDDYKFALEYLQSKGNIECYLQNQI